jgi:hypothetical protein
MLISCDIRICIFQLLPAIAEGRKCVETFVCEWVTRFICTIQFFAYILIGFHIQVLYSRVSWVL